MPPEPASETSQTQAPKSMPAFLADAVMSRPTLLLVMICMAFWAGIADLVFHLA